MLSVVGLSMLSVVGVSMLSVVGVSMLSVVGVTMLSVVGVTSSPPFPKEGQGWFVKQCPNLISHVYISQV